MKIRDVTPGMTLLGDVAQSTAIAPASKATPAFVVGENASCWIIPADPRIAAQVPLHKWARTKVAGTTLPVHTSGKVPQT